MEATMYNTKTFVDVWGTVSDFVDDYKSCALYDPGNTINDGNAQTLYFLLYARYGNTPIAN